MSSTEAPLVTVTGASGFIALHCIRALLDGGWRVRGTIRSLDKAAGVRAALADVPDLDDRLTLVAAELMHDDGWPEAVEGSTYVLHTASPVLARRPRDPQEVIAPAQQGTRRVLEASAAAGVRRVVFTSSVAAVLSGRSRGPHVFTEDDWSDLDGEMPAYSRGKTLAERDAWALVRGLPAGRSMELVTVNPTYVLGPSLSVGGNASNELVRKLLDREVPGVPRLMLPVVDVRDVAALHVLAMTRPEAAGQRFIASEGDYWYAEVARMLADSGQRVPTRVVPDWLVRVLGWFDPTVRLVVGELGIECHVSSDKARRMLGWTTRPVEETLRDTAADMLARRLTFDV
ncbi:dihydroflavonol-4-reductase [Luteitalea sp. TBR-22]|uniref:SDR family oxidoreductase n=1 Tax=Luteitalea sp. TBR-22 TaxID=2802971 RepID=UPI001AFC8C34|nr:aldehyde reductase [Luteitalea sp. TBR-22]BCS35106.1 dihydroflavonol-4-reductase [Luteitalea sp. TBR-22]